MSVSEPGKIITPWAESGLKNPIPPAANPATGRAGFDQGFSAINMTAKEAGGIPPFGQDFNGIFYEITNILRYMQAGGQPTFDAALATAIGGYPKGAMVLGSDGVTLWQSKINSNSANPNSSPSSWSKVDIGLKEFLSTSQGSASIGDQSGLNQGQINEVSRSFYGESVESAGSIKVVCGSSSSPIPGGFYVMTSDGGENGLMIEVVSGNVAAPSLPSDSENGSWALWRTGLIYALENAWIGKTPVPSTGVWTTGNLSISAVNPDGSPDVGAFRPVIYHRSAVSAGGAGIGNSISQQVVVPKTGILRIGFMCTSTSPTAQEIKINGLVAATVNTNSPLQNSVMTVEVACPSGPQQIEIIHTELGTNLYVLGFNFYEISELKGIVSDVDFWSSYTRSPSYVINRGASEYAFKNRNGGMLWAGSYHGGESAIQPAEFSLDHSLISIGDNTVMVGKRFSILQNTSLTWSGTSDIIKIASLTTFCGAGVTMDCAAYDASLLAHTAYLGMGTTSPAFDSAIGAKYFNDATTSGENYQMGPNQTVSQIERSTGRMARMNFSLPPFLANSFGGMTVSFASGAYAKVYPGFIRNDSVQVPSSFAWSFRRTFM